MSYIRDMVLKRHRVESINLMAFFPIPYRVRSGDSRDPMVNLIFIPYAEMQRRLWLTLDEKNYIQ